MTGVFSASYSDEHGIRKGVTSPISRLVLFPDSPFNLESCSSDENLFSLEETAYVLLPLVIPSKFPPTVINHAPFFVFISFFYNLFRPLCVLLLSSSSPPEFIACSWKAVLLCVTHSRNSYHLVLLFDGVSVYFSEHFLGVKPQGSLGNPYVYNV